MTKTPTPSNSANANPTQLNLVNSSRLQSLVKKNAIAEPLASPPKDTSPFQSNRAEDVKTARLRKQINERLAQILTQLPQGKQHKLFKIRFGVSLEEIRNLPIERAAQILKLTPFKP